MLRVSPQALIARRYEHRVLAVMLVCLHLSIWWDFGGALSRSLMLAHLGLFLLWQPLWSRERQLDLLSGLVSVVAVAVFVVFLNWPLVTFWLVLLTGFIGGRVTVGRTNRYAFVLTLVFLVSELLIGCIPPLVDVAALPPDAPLLFANGMLLVPVGLFFIPVADPASDRDQPVDFLYGLTASLLASILAMGSLLGTFLTGALYPVAVIQTILAIAAFLLAISWLWMPLAGFSGLGQLWERYVQNIGTPFERWLSRLTRSSQTLRTPEDFLTAAMRQIDELPWVAGVTWSGEHSGSMGRTSAHQFRSKAGGLLIEVSTERPIGTTLLLHGTLLLRLVGHFYQAKRREQELAQRAHLQAVYETGARVTHDIKNLLQSLHTLGSALEHDTGGDRSGVQSLLARQLPHIVQRLRLALDKLQVPSDTMVVHGDLADWWQSTRTRNVGPSIDFVARIDEARAIPVELFDSVVENLLENARFKRQSEPAIDIRVELESDDAGVRLAVCDTGSPIDPAKRTRLFEGPVESSSGLGIGLYQAARQAAHLGYRLQIRDIERGVCVEMVEVRPGDERLESIEDAASGASRS